jgi:hypothetical protein
MSAPERRSRGVVHCQGKQPGDGYDVYIGREIRRYGLTASKWANPYKVGRRDGTREEVIVKYEHWLLSQPDLMAALPELTGKVLGCWCTPKPCHGDVLVRLANPNPSAARAQRSASSPSTRPPGSEAAGSGPEPASSHFDPSLAKPPRTASGRPVAPLRGAPAVEPHLASAARTLQAILNAKFPDRSWQVTVGPKLPKESS